ncbi:MAG TPA: outer membrane protein assembly factor BamD [Quisquiliibacterium sp.]|nr:outer membrane protein assembly factor BamD [Quisquiliibacterium sp.]
MKNGSWFWRMVAAAIAVLLVAGCKVADPPDPTLSWTPERLYADARDDMQGGRWDVAIKTLEKIEARYPFGRWAQQAQIDIAYSYYRQGERALALAATDRFLKLYPNHASLDYVYYLRGLINFNDQEGWIARFGGQDLSERDLKAARDAFDAFKQVVTRFPESKYAADSEVRMKYLVNAMASGEVHVARYYFERGAYVAASNRAQNAIRGYPQAPAIEEALYILMTSQDRLGLPDLRDDTRRVLERNFPQSPWLAGKNPRGGDPSWWQVWR